MVRVVVGVDASWDARRAPPQTRYVLPQGPRARSPRWWCINKIRKQRRPPQGSAEAKSTTCLSTPRRPRSSRVPGGSYTTPRRASPKRRPTGGRRPAGPLRRLLTAPAAVGSAEGAGVTAPDRETWHYQRLPGPTGIGASFNGRCGSRTRWRCQARREHLTTKVTKLFVFDGVKARGGRGRDLRRGGGAGGSRDRHRQRP